MLCSTRIVLGNIRYRGDFHLKIPGFAMCLFLLKKIEELPFVKVSFYKNVYMVDNATIAEWVSKFILDGKKETLLDVLRVFDFRILDITTIV